jgi:acyl carrier protein
MPESGIDDAQLRDELLDLIAKEGLVGRDRLTEDATFESLGLASIDIVMLLMAIEEKYNVYLPIDAELSGIRTLPELLDLLVAKIRSAPAADADARSKAYGSSPSPDADKPA